MTRTLPLAALLSALIATPALAVPVELHQEGRLVDPQTDEPIIGAHVARFALYDAAEGGEVVWEQTSTIQCDASGYFATTLGSQDDPLDSTIFTGEPMWIELTLDSGEPMEPRLSLASVPYAIRAEVADRALVADALSSPIGFDELEGTPDELTDGDDDSLAQITCAPGDTLGWVDTGWDCLEPGALAPAVCPSGQYAVARLASGALECAVPSFDDLSGVPPDIADGDSDLLSTIVCGGNERLIFDGTSWTCASNISGTCGFGSILVGIRPDGSLDCFSFTSLLSLLNATCPQGQYLAGINGINPNCRPLPDGVAAFDVLGMSEASPAESCAEARTSGLGVDGPVWIQRAGDPDPVQRWCTHSIEGGDWLMVHNSVASPNTKWFWSIPRAEALDASGRADIDANYVDGSLYTWTNDAPRVVGRPVEVLDVVEDVRGKRAVLVHADAASFDDTTMTFTGAQRLGGLQAAYDAHVAGGFSAPDSEGDPDPGNCAQTYGATQHYGAGCIVYSLAEDLSGEGVATGPSIQTSALGALGLTSVGGAYSKVTRVTRYIRY